MIPLPQRRELGEITALCDEAMEDFVTLEASGPLIDLEDIEAASLKMRLACANLEGWLALNRAGLRNCGKTLATQPHRIFTEVNEVH